MFCIRCHKKGDLTTWMDDIKLCKACNYKLSEMLDFMEHFGYGVMRLMGNDDAFSADHQLPQDGRRPAEEVPAK